MQIRPLGASGIAASVVALGCWAMGGWRWGGCDDDVSIQAIQTGIDAGITLIDTAPVYGFGHSETIVGKAIAGRRDQVVLATKCGMVWDREEGDFFFQSDDAGHVNQGRGHKIYKYLDPRSIKLEVDASLKRLGTDHIDLLQTHWQDSTTPVVETMGALMELKEEGKILAIGACNANVEQLTQYAGAGELSVDQERYSMLDRKMDAEQLPWCRQNNVAVFAYSPMSHGLLSGKVVPGRTYGDGDLRGGGNRFTDENISKALAMLDLMRPVADKYAINLAQLAVAWTLAQPGLTHALVGARSPEQAVENAHAGSVVLDEEDLSVIGAAIDEHGPGIE
jgi:methylglyoxal reductase